MTSTETPQKRGERGGVLTTKQYELIAEFHRSGTLPSPDELGDIGDPKLSASNKIGRFKSWARRMYLRLSDETLMHKLTGKIILPREQFEYVIMDIHRGSPASGQHLSTAATLGKLMKKYTFGKRSFGMNEDIVKLMVKSCSTGSCGKRRKHQKRHRRREEDKKERSEDKSTKKNPLFSPWKPKRNFPVVKPKKIASKTSQPATTTAPVSNAPGSVGNVNLNPYYKTVNLDVFNRCLPSSSTGGLNQATTTFIPHPVVPPNYFGVPQSSLQYIPGLPPNVYLLPHNPTSINFMSMLQATAPQTRQLNPGSNLPGHIVNPTSSLSLLQRGGIQAEVTKSMSDSLKAVKNPELAKMLASPALLNASTVNTVDGSDVNASSVFLPPPPLLGPHRKVETLVDTVESNGVKGNSRNKKLGDEKTITICVYPFPTSSGVSSLTGSITNQQTPTAAESTRTNAAPVACQENSRLQEDMFVVENSGSPRRSAAANSSYNTKKKLKAKICSSRKDSSEFDSSEKINEGGDASTRLGRPPNSQKSIKLDKARLLHLLKKEKSPKVKALLIRTLRRLKKRPQDSYLNLYHSNVGNDTEVQLKCQTVSVINSAPVNVVLGNISPLPDNKSEDESSHLSEWNRKCVSVLGEKIDIHEHPMCSTFGDEILEKDMEEELPFPESIPIPFPHIWHHYKDIRGEKHCFHRLLPVIRDMKLDIMKSVMRNYSAADSLKKKIAYGESLVRQYKDYISEHED